MSFRRLSTALTTCVIALLCGGCKDIARRPQYVAERPSQVLQFPVLYAENCRACHGADGKNGAAISLGNPVYLAFAGTNNLERVTVNGVAGTLMPPFAKSQGGTLTDQQIQVLVQGMESAWGNTNSLGGATLPAYASISAGDPAAGEKAFTSFCAQCHGVDGSGAESGKSHTGSIVDPAYLALISNQGLRSLIVAGKPLQGMPDWRSDATGAGSRPMTDQEITDTVAWLASHRIETPGQPYRRP